MIVNPLKGFIVFCGFGSCLIMKWIFGVIFICFPVYTPVLLTIFAQTLQEHYGAEDVQKGVKLLASSVPKIFDYLQARHKGHNTSLLDDLQLLLSTFIIWALCVVSYTWGVVTCGYLTE